MIIQTIVISLPFKSQIFLFAMPHVQIKKN
jgi:hypothetical protein